MSENNEGMDAEYTSMVREVTPNFADNLRRAFNNAGVRAINTNGNKPIKLRDTAFSRADIYYKLTNINLISYPDFRITTLEPDLENFFIQSDFNLGTLTITCDFEVVNKTMFEAFSIAQYGQLTMKINKVRSSGTIGFYNVEDSFVIKTYGGNYTISDLETETRTVGLDGELEIETMTAVEYRITPVILIWPQLVEQMNNILNRQLGGVIVEYSVSEMLIDNPDPLREHQRHRKLKANSIFDNILNKAKDAIVADDLKTVLIDPLIVTFKQSNTSTDRGGLLTGKGRIGDMSTLTRTGDVSLVEQGSNTTVYGYLTMRDLKVEFDSYDINYMNSTLNGKIKITVRSFKMLVSLTVDRKFECIYPAKTQVVNLSDIETDISGLQSLSWLHDHLQPWVEGYISHHSEVIRNVFVDSIHIMAPACE